MSAGGPTWDTAGALTLDANNTFDLDDAGDEPPLLDLAWWSYTPTFPGLLHIDDGGVRSRVYHGSDDDRVQDFPLSGHGNAWLVREGVEYRILAYLEVDDDPPAGNVYQLTASQEAWTAQPWNDEFQDNPDNALIISHGTGVEANPNPFYRFPIFDAPGYMEWVQDVIRQVQGRRGRYTIQEVLGGAALDELAYACAIGHANNGDPDGSQHWNNTGSGTDPTTPPVCLPLGVGPAEGNSEDSTGYKVVHTDPDAPGAGIAGQVHADFNGPAYALFHNPVRDNLNPWGVLEGVNPDPADYGVPAEVIDSGDYALEWEYPTVDLLGIQIADGDPIAVGDSPPLSSTWVLNDPIGPIPEPGFSTVWQKGPVGQPPSGPEDPENPWLKFGYKDGNETTGEFHDVPHTDGWKPYWLDDYTYVPDVSPNDWDGVVIAWPEGEALLGDHERSAHIAVKYLLNARRFRFVYKGGGPAPRRIIQRKKDGLVGSGERTIGGRPTRQSGNRTIGGQL